MQQIKHHEIKQKKKTSRDKTNKTSRDKTNKTSRDKTKKNEIIHWKVKNI